MLKKEIELDNLIKSGLIVPKQAKENSLRLSLVIPTYNESGNIARLIEILCGLLDKKIPGDYELIIVDDNSPDRTWELAVGLVKIYPQLRVIRRENESGLSTAVIRGWQASRGRILGAIDGDLQHPPEIVLRLLDAMEEGADLALASRHVEGGGVSEWSIQRRILSRGAQVLGLILLPEVIARVSDPMSGYFLLRRSCVEEKPLSPLGYKILVEVLGRGAIGPIREVGYVFEERKEGASKVTWRQSVEYLMHILKLRLWLWQIGRFIRFGTVGFSGVFVDMSVLFLLSDPKMLGWGLIRSKIIAAELALVNNFIWNDLWTFGDISRKQPGAAKRLKRLLKFNIICLVGLAINVVILNLLVNFFGINRYLANLAAIITASIWNFWLNLKLSWRTSDVSG